MQRMRFVLGIILATLPFLPACGADVTELVLDTPVSGWFRV